MSCNRTKRPVLTKQTGLAIAPEFRYGKTHGELVGFPVYNFDIVNNGVSKLQSSQKVNEHSSRNFGFGKFYDVRIDSYITEDRSWKNLLFGCGFYEKEDRLLLSEYPGSFFAQCNYGTNVFSLSGNRGSFGLSAIAGNPISLRYTGRSLDSPVVDTFDGVTQVEEISVPLFEGAGITFKLPNGEIYTPIVKEFNLSYERNVENRLSGGDPTATVTEIYHLPDFAMKLDFILEYDSSVPWESYFMNNNMFGDITLDIDGIIRLGQGTGTKIFLDNMPTLGDTSNIRVVNLKFNLIGPNCLFFEFP